MVKKLLIVFLFFLPIYAEAQPATPCTPNVGSWTVDTTTATLWVCNSNGTTWINATAGTPTVPSGLITIITTGTCAAGWTELSALNGKTLFGTVAANGDVGGTGGSDTITPAGTNGTSATTATGTINTPTISWPAGVPTFTGTPFSSIINHTHPITDAGHAHTQASTTTATGSGSNRLGTVDTSSTAVNTGTATTGITVDNPVGGVSSITPAGTIAWPAGVPTSNALTFTGSSSTVSAQTFTGTQFDNRSAYIKVIFCVKD